MTTAEPSPALHLAVALSDAGWHPAAWREPDARSRQLLSAGYWTDLAQEAERGLLDFVTIEDSLALQSDDPWREDRRVDRVRGRLDAVLIAARTAPRTRHLGFVPTVVVTHTEPFHIAKAIATLDYVSSGRAGVRVRVSASAAETAHVGRRELPAISGPDDPAVDAVIDELFDEAEEYVEVVRRLWDSWEDDAEIRDAPTGRFIDRDKVHYIDFVGRHFTVKGPSITPRPPQGQPLVTALGHRRRPFELIARATDVGFVTPHDAAGAAAIVADIGGGPHVFGDLVVFLDADAATARSRQARLDEAAGEPYTSDAYTYAGDAAGLADLLLDWRSAGLTGFRLRPATLPHDLESISRLLVPELQRRGVFRTAYTDDTLRGRLGLPRPANRYATA